MSPKLNSIMTIHSKRWKKSVNLYIKPKKRMEVKQNNIFPVWKPQSLSSGDVVKTIKSKLQLKKVGHCGTLDPFAEGLLIVVSGSETSNSDKYMGDIKTYRTVISLGDETDTLDNTGEIIRRADVTPDKYSQEFIEQILSSFTGNIKQRPPAFSAKRINGVRLYKLARQDVFVHLKPVDINIDNIKFISLDDNELTIEVICQKGTYIRQLGRDIARAMGTRGHLKSLVRTEVGSFNYENSVKLEDIENWNC